MHIKKLKDVYSLFQCLKYYLNNSNSNLVPPISMSHIFNVSVPCPIEEVNYDNIKVVLGKYLFRIGFK